MCDLLRLPDIRIFLSFDTVHDTDLRDQLVEQATRPGSGFAVAALSESVGSLTPTWDARVRKRIREADEVVVICGQHTTDSEAVSAELRIAQEEEKPYFLLWGRRELMCMRPAGARPADSMYSWTWEILRSQIATTLRNAQPRQATARERRP